MQRRLSRLPAALAALSLVITLAACGSNTDRPTLADDNTPKRSVTLDPALVGCDPKLDSFQAQVAYAKNDGELALYANRGDATPARTMSNPRMTDSDPPLPVPLAFLVKEAPKDDNCQWLNVYLPERPNGSTAWVKRDDMKVQGQDYKIDVYLNEFNIKAWDGTRLILDAPIGVARDNAPTPGGLYYTTELLKPSDPNGVYGQWAFGLSGFSETLTTFNGGQGQLGIHGTNEPDKIGSKVSSGCIRLKNEDITKLVNTIAADDVYGIPVQVHT